MRVGMRVLAGLGLSLMVACQGPSTAEEAAPEMSTEEMMAMMAELGEPGEGHRRLDPMVGTFDAKTKMWMTPGAEPDESVGTCTNEWILGGRYLQTSFEGSMMGQPFSGVGMTGYNNATGAYEGVWVDSMSTLIMPPGRGTVDESGKVFEFIRTIDNMFPGETSGMREVMTIIDENQHTMAMYEVHPDGSEHQTLEIVYTRR